MIPRVLTRDSFVSAPQLAPKSVSLFSYHYRLFCFFTAKPVARMDPLESTIKEKESVSVNCYATGNPTPTYKWKFLRDINRE